MSVPRSDCAITIMVRKGICEFGHTGGIVTFSVKRDTEDRVGYQQWYSVPSRRRARSALKQNGQLLC